MTTLSGSHTLVLMCSLKPFHPHFYNFFLFAQILKQKKKKTTNERGESIYHQSAVKEVLINALPASLAENKQEQQKRT